MAKNRKYSMDLREPRSGASEEALDAFERDTGAEIPPEYRKFLACQNGGAPVRRNISWGKGPYEDSVIRSFFGVKCPFAFDLAFMLDRYAGRIPEDTFPIADDEFDNLLLISRKRGSANQILFWDHEKEISGGAPAYVAADLREFLEKLEADKVVECEIATITFEDGKTFRRVLPFKFRSADLNAVIEVRDAKIGERIDDHGTIRTVAKIEYHRESMISRRRLPALPRDSEPSQLRRG
jgi:hypothetical protein